ncbi:SDR family oxidoreductase [Propylenella binzhouense]|uniref:SDR family oxidoreductase n=1 Tax=Propylenella binzhouense TaxID=2555902 RepID=A0A964T7C0_9HYPH|nr:SDR family oxidoreductase [Propylenella binzhouense]MYZ49886.1 SDR family oxidoreductase [Propylenella binzhouense]
MTGLLVFGMGYSASAAVTRLRTGVDRVLATTRGAEKALRLESDGIEAVVFDGAHPAPDVADRLKGLEHVLVSIAPDQDGDPVLRAFGREIARARPCSIVYLSTVGVYGDHGGAWVDEATPCRPVSQRSGRRRAAEADWQRFGREEGIPVAILRLAGIYGPGRGPFEKIRAGTARRIVKPGQVFNRIHVDDIAAIVEAAFARRADGIFNGSDDEPAPPQDVLAHAAALLGTPPPPEVAYADAEMTPMARSFYAENKRVRSARVRPELGVELAHPTYREGLAATLAREALP